MLFEHYICMCILKFQMHKVVNHVAHHISFLKNFLLMFQFLFPEKILNQQILPIEIFDLFF